MPRYNDSWYKSLRHALLIKYVRSGKRWKPEGITDNRENMVPKIRAIQQLKLNKEE